MRLRRYQRRVNRTFNRLCDLARALENRLGLALVVSHEEVGKTTIMYPQLRANPLPPGRLRREKPTVSVPRKISIILANSLKHEPLSYVQASLEWRRTAAQSTILH